VEIGHVYPSRALSLDLIRRKSDVGPSGDFREIETLTYRSAKAEERRHPAGPRWSVVKPWMLSSIDGAKVLGPRPTGSGRPARPAGNARGRSSVVVSVGAGLLASGVSAERACILPPAGSGLLVPKGRSGVEMGTARDGRGGDRLLE